MTRRLMTKAEMVLEGLKPIRPRTFHVIPYGGQYGFTLYGEFLGQTDVAEHSATFYDTPGEAEAAARARMAELLASGVEFAAATFIVEED